MLTRRDWMRITAGAGAALAIDSRLLGALQEPEIMKPIPSSGEKISVIGLGGRWISTNSTPEELVGHRAVLNALAKGAPPSGRVFDSAAGYGGGASEDLSGDWAVEDGLQNGIFWATKVNVAGRGGPADPAEVRAQIRRSFERLRLNVIDLDQVHNMGDPPTQLGILKEFKDEGHIRYIGITTTSEGQYPALAKVMRDYPIDFIGIDYAVDNRVAEQQILPLAIERGIAVMVYLPFGRNRMWQRIGDRPLPEWAAEFGAHAWSQLMLKFVVSHPGVTVAAPGTGNPAHMIENLGAARGRLPTEDERRRILRLVESLPGG